MLDHHLVDLDELILSVRDRNSREYINEAVVCYRARAYRSALMAAWIAVAYDIIAKIRELALQGDPQASAFVSDLEAAIALKLTAYETAVKKLQEIENGLLSKALEKFEFLSQQEQSDLERLKQDRNLCAHPAFTSETMLFQPSPELVRMHIAHAIVHLLQHPPVQGKTALARIRDAMVQPSFPSTQAEVSELLESEFLNRAKKTFLESLVTVCLKTIIKQTEASLIGKEQSVLHCLVALRSRHPHVYEQRMAVELPNLTSVLNDIELKRVFLLFRADKRCWAWISESNRIRLVEMAKKYAYNSSDVEQVLSGLDIDELRSPLLDKISRFDSREKEEIISRYPRPEFVDEALNLLASSRSYRGSEHVEQRLVLPLSSMFRGEHVIRLLEVAEQNDQVNAAGGTPAFLADIFERTVDLQGVTKHAWQRFLTKMVHGKSPDDWYAYPALRKKMEAAEMWPL